MGSRILSVKYGAGDIWCDVTEKVQLLVEKFGIFPIANTLFGVDPLYGQRKKLRVKYSDEAERLFDEGALFASRNSSHHSIGNSNLIYHIAPFSASREIWKWNIRILGHYSECINGRVIVGIVIGDGLDSVDDVLSEFEANRIKIDTVIIRENDPHLGEMVTFPHLMAEIASRDPSECTFYAHAKGVSRNDFNSDYEPLAVRLWTAYLYHYTLGKCSRVADLLSEFPAIGMYLRTNCSLNGIYSPQQYFAGSFFAFRNRELFSRQWNSMENNKFGTERYCSRMFQPWEMGAVLDSKFAESGILKNDRNEYYLNSWLESIESGDLEELPEAVTRGMIPRSILNSQKEGSEPVVTICVLTYGDYYDLVFRCIESIRKNCKRSLYRLFVGANAVSDRTRRYLEDLAQEGHIDRIYFSEININKCPMMRRMFANVETELIWWFDDDSYITESYSLLKWLQIAETSAEDTMMWGHVFFFGHENDFNYGTDVVGYIKRASWYQGKTPPSWEIGGKDEFDFEGRGTGDGRWFFATGGCWLVRTRAIQELDWPNINLVKRNDDVVLAEAIRQKGWKMQDVGALGVAINQSMRRGGGEDKETMTQQMEG